LSLFGSWSNLQNQRGGGKRYRAQVFLEEDIIVFYKIMWAAWTVMFFCFLFTHQIDRALIALALALANLALAEIDDLKRSIENEKVAKIN
jgi:hypothetical protein